MEVKKMTEDLVNEEPKREDLENASEAKDGEQPAKSLSPLEETREMLQQITEQNRIVNDNINRLEEMKANDQLGGTSHAGSAPEKPKEETPAEYAKKVLSGEL